MFHERNQGGRGVGKVGAIRVPSLSYAGDASKKEGVESGDVRKVIDGRR